MFADILIQQCSQIKFGMLQPCLFWMKYDPTLQWEGLIMIAPTSMFSNSNNTMMIVCRLIIAPATLMFSNLQISLHGLASYDNERPGGRMCCLKSNITRSYNTWLLFLHSHISSNCCCCVRIPSFISFVQSALVNTWFAQTCLWSSIVGCTYYRQWWS